MTVRWLWWVPLGLLVAGGALFGLRMRYVAMTVTESDVISRYATRNVAEHGPSAKRTDCVGRPMGRFARVWLAVSCRTAGPNPRGYDYYVNRLGGFEYGESTIAVWENAT